MPEGCIDKSTSVAQFVAGIDDAGVLEWHDGATGVFREMVGHKASKPDVSEPVKSVNTRR